MNCVIYLVRHGIAAPAAAGMSDADRPLTPAGERKVVRIARGLKRLGVEPDAVVSSPLPRAADTARLLMAGLAPGVEVELDSVLSPGSAASAAMQVMTAYRGARQLMLVGHEPGMGELASQLLTGSATLASLPFKKGGVAAIRVGALPPRAPGMLLWLLTPKQLRLIGR